ncbi:MAG: hypothetical protein KDB27_12770, partial [Planctomycetales bacterium]|nr:hypothetical protein [Planctomycetales bacterium]
KERGDDADDIAASEVLDARLNLAYKYLDWEEYQKAEDTFAKLIEEAQSNKFKEVLQENAIDTLRSKMNVAKSRQLIGVVDKQDERRELLKKALNQDRSNIDILIELYNLPGNSDEFKKEINTRIEYRVSEYQKRIDAYSASYNVERYGSTRQELYMAYNEYAWLVSNTTGDFEKALEYSKRSLDLYPNSPDYLDTLARCYYANGQYDVAVIHQRKAAKARKSMGQVQRQLDLFEQAYAEELAKEATIQPSPNGNQNRADVEVDSES